VTEVADRVDLPKSTVARLLGSLAREGVVEQVPGGTRYRLGARIASLAAGVASTTSLVAVARPHLVELASALGETAGLSVPDGFQVHYIDQVDTTHQVQIRDWTGTRVPMHAVSSGLLILASWPEAELERFLERPLERFTPRTMTDPSTLRERLAQIRTDGYAWVHEEFAEGLNSVAAPIADRSGAVVAAVHVHGPSYRFPDEADQAAIGTQAVKAAARISARFRRANSEG
jgi:DNA-binding IclR family transcriptional regulator